MEMPTAPVGDTAAMTKALQADMTRHAAFLRDEQGIRAMMEHLHILTEQQEPVVPSDPQAVQKLRLADMVVTQSQVLSAMLYDLTHQDVGVLMTCQGVSRRRPARPIPERDQWFERVWRNYREQEEQQ